jgi:hypothetical protein
MGTRSLTILPGFDGETAVLYRQMDGYPSGHGQELVEYLQGFDEVVNGIGQEVGKIANGPECLSALIVSHFKGQEAGGFYLYPAGTRDAGEEYLYFVSAQAGEPVKLKVESVYDDGQVLFDGPVSEWDLATVEKAAGE